MHVRRTLALTVTVPLLLAGCSDPAEPTPKMPESTSSSPSPTQSETPEAESAEDFIRRWQAAALKAQNTGDTDRYRDFGPDCRPCRDFADQVEDIYGNGGTVELESLRVIGVKSSGAHQYELVRVLGRTRVLDADGDEEQSFAGGREVLKVILEPHAGGWRVKTFLRTAA